MWGLLAKTILPSVFNTVDSVIKNKDEADNLFLEGGGIDYDEIKTSLTKTNKGVETSYIDASYTESDDTQYVGKVIYDADDEYAKEDGNVIIDSYMDEEVTVQ